ncbi:AI-2E family transporter [Halovivax limisalsi]|uniref:AI-2E family transporter n=1 Tax=Halovivax limisalsi TaxID=1453760 RepID=UPI001FFDC68A|nr:AI-2E family transporter [Halovivax limisalsi]
MSGRSGRTTWPPDRVGLTVLAVGAALLAAWLILPYLQYVLFGVVLAYALAPAQRRLERYLGPTMAAVSLVIATLVVVLVPLVVVLSIAIRQSFGVVRAIRDGSIDVEAIEGELANIGLSVDLMTLYESNQGRIATALEGIGNAALGVVGGAPGFFIGATIALFVLFGLLRDGGRLLAWLTWVIPADDEDLGSLWAGLDELMWASIVGNVAVAAIQAVLLGVGLAVAGVPSVIFLTVATFVLTLLPLVGAFAVWVPVSAYLLAVGRPVAAVGIAVFGLFVTLSDTYIRPALIGRTEAYNAVTVTVGIFGGLVAFGPVGLFLGPVVLGGAKLALDAFAEERTGASGPETRGVEEIISNRQDATGDEIEDHGSSE